MCRKLTTFLVALIFIPLFTLEVLLFTFYNRGLNENLYKEALAGEGIYDLLYEQIEPPLVEELYLSAKENGFEFSKAELHAFFVNVFPGEILKKELNKNIDNLFLYIKGKEEVLEIKLSLVEIKRAAEPELIKLIERQFQSFPVCRSSEDLERLGRGDLTMCIPPGIEKEEYLKALKSELEPILGDLLANSPEAFDLTQSLDTLPIEELRTITARVVQLMVVILLGLIISLVGLVFLLSYSGKILFRGVGLSFFGASSLTLGILFFLKYLALRVVREVTAGLMPPSGSEIQGRLLNFVGDLTSLIFNPIIYQVSIFAALGVFLFLISFSVKSWPSKDQLAP